jgi:hypothetical protein
MNMTISQLPWSVETLYTSSGGPAHAYIRDALGQIIGSMLDAQNADHAVNLVNCEQSSTSIQDLKEEVEKLEGDIVNLEETIAKLEKEREKR